MDITKQPKPTQTHITEHVTEPATPPADYELPSVRHKQTDFVGYALLIVGVAAVTLLMAVIGGWPLLCIAVLVMGLALVHYFTWGRSMNRRVAEEQANEFRRRLEMDKNNLSEVETPRHY